MHIGKISKKKIYTAQELLEKEPITGKLAREIAELERQYEKMYGKKEKQKPTIKVKDLVDEITKISDVSFEKHRNEYFIKFKGKTLCRTADRKYGISIGMRVDRKYETIKVKNKKDLDKNIDEIKEKIKCQQQEE